MTKLRNLGWMIGAVLVGMAIANIAQATDVYVKSYQKISDTEGGFTGVLDNSGLFGISLAPLGDLDGDDVTDIAVGAYRNDDGGYDRGAVWILFLHQDGTVKNHQKISSTKGGFGGIIDNQDLFGKSVASLGDFDNDGFADILVGTPGDEDGGFNKGAAWILFLNSDGTVKSYQKISATNGGFLGTLHDGDQFGESVACLGDLDGDGVTDIAVGAFYDDDGAEAAGAVWILLLNADGTVKAHQKISNSYGGFSGILDSFDAFGVSVSSPGDLDNDGVTDIAVGASEDDDGGNNRGAVWLLFMNTNGTVKSHQKISATQGNFTGLLDGADRFGFAVEPLGDFDLDGVPDIAVTAFRDNDGGNDRGAVWILFLNTDGTVKHHQKISDTEGSFAGTLDDSDWFGASVTSIGDLNGDGVTDIVVGADADDDGGTNRGAVWVLFLEKVELLELEIVGPNEMAENFSAQYQAIAHYDNDTTIDVTNNAIWSVAPDSIASIEAGLLTTGDVDKAEPITISAQYSEGEVTLDAEKMVSVLAICPRGTALEFDGQNDYVEVPYDDSLGFTDEITLEVWVNITTTAGATQHYVVDSRDGTGGGYGVNVDTELIQFWIAGTWYRNFPSTISIGNWHHVVGTYDGSNMIVYVDGAEVDRYSVATSIIPSTSSLFIGQWYGHGERFQGIMDKVAIYNRALSAEEIWANVHTRPDTGDTSLVAYWDFDEVSGQVAGDSSGNGNDGQLGSTPDADDSDPEWVESDAPMGICTLIDIAVSNLEAALASKAEALDAIDTALARERTANSTLRALLHSDDMGDLEAWDILKAQLRIYWAMIREKLSQRILDKSIGNLQALLGILAGESGAPGSPGGGNDEEISHEEQLQRADINADGVIDAQDFAILSQYWLEAY